MKTNNIKNIKIIDVHGHLGDILHLDGGELIFKTGVKFPASFLEWLLSERTLYKETFLYRTSNKISPLWSVKCEQKRNAASTLENLRKSLEDTNILKCVCAPVAPNNTYGDMLAATKSEPRIIPFTSPDFTSENINIMKSKLETDLKNGAMGVKIHPILQEAAADSEAVMSAVQSAQPYCKPVLLHAGPAQYYLPSKKSGNRPRFDDFASVERIERLIAAFPNVNFIVGHAGLDDFRKVIEIMPKYKNAYVDTSFQYPQSIRDLIKTLGGERVMFASDWHYGLRKPMISTVFEVCKNDPELQKMVFYENAANLLGINL